MLQPDPAAPFVLTPDLAEGGLVDRIYEAALVPELWRGVLNDIAAAAGARHALLLATRGTDPLGWVTTSPECEAMMLGHFERFPDNVRTRRLLAARRAGFLTDRDLLTEVEIGQEPLYQDFLIPEGYGSGTATAIHAPSGDDMIVHCERPFAEGSFGPAALSFLDGLRPHLARASLLSARLELERAEAAARALEIIGLPAAVLDRAGRAMAANTPLVGMMPATVRDLPSRLALADPAADRLLVRALATPDMAATGGVSSIPVAAREDRPAVVVHLVPIRGAARDIFSKARFMLVATPVVPAAVPTASVVQGLFDLTPSEARLAALIAAGHPPRDAATKLGIAEQTVRSTLKRIFQKTGVTRQAELVGLLSGAALRP